MSKDELKRLRKIVNDLHDFGPSRFDDETGEETEYGSAYRELCKLAKVTSDASQETK